MSVGHPPPLVCHPNLRPRSPHAKASADKEAFHRPYAGRRRPWHFVDEVPNPNYFDLRFTVCMYANAWGDLFKGIFAGWTEGKDYKESFVSIAFRGIGLLIPGGESHGFRDYVNGGRLAQLVQKSMV
ncbi:hypothetical protein HPP92_003899 [Vanilla planifolia]|uniref:Uncharacterized protein n=1 Tax=Vanilla planifolia TaxID=51239 RepID=A0A835VLX7_VANPL|nr:hypothetical protein HPP92_003899 [Vanilla planifolia]